MSQHIIAIDVSSTAARVTVIEATLRRAQLLSVSSIPLERDMAPADMWAKIRADLQYPLDAVVVGLDARATSTRLLTFPFGDLRKAEAAVNFELEGQVPYALEDIASTYCI
ncbi:MAG TPA: hypothetical protein VFH51_10815, partial [Myxococcota bacterium]|nr:hypothetical protein [Myxococcota bacterium]